MPSPSAALRLQIETALQPRIPGALTPRPRTYREVQATAIPELDALLEGGLPIGAISEFVGPLCSGRTTLAMATLAEMTQNGKTVAWVDACDALDPLSAAAAGIDLAKQLWIRCGHKPADPFTSGAQQACSSGPALLIEGSRTPATGGGCGSPHPRSEVRGLSEAVDAFFKPDVFSRPAPPRDPAVGRRNRMIGTPGAPNRKLSEATSSDTYNTASLDRTPQDPRPFPRRSRDREEQVPTDRQPSRRQVFHARQAPSSHSASLQAAQIANTAAAAHRREAAAKNSWTDNRNNAAGRSLATPPNAIAAGLPRFQEMEARANGQGHTLPRAPLTWRPEPSRLRPKTNPANSLAGDPPVHSGKTRSPFWHSLDQALRATDLLLAGGGFGAIVLDLGGIPPEFAWRIPLATWFRFRAGADRARTALILLTQHACARSSAELVLRLSPAESRDAGTVLTGAIFRVELDRRRFETQTSSLHSPAVHEQANRIHLVAHQRPSQASTAQRKPPQRSTAWLRSTAWAAASSPAQGDS